MCDCKHLRMWIVLNSHVYFCRQPLPLRWRNSARKIVKGVELGCLKIQTNIIKFLLIRLPYKTNLKNVLCKNTCVLLGMNAKEEIWQCDIPPFELSLVLCNVHKTDSQNYTPFAPSFNLFITQ